MNAFLTILARIPHTTLVVVIFVVLAGGGMVIYERYSQYKGLMEQRRDLERQIDYKKHEIKVLKDNQQRVQTDPEFAERVGRMNKRIKPGELIFTFETEEDK
jgi:hypothetical protein